MGIVNEDVERVRAATDLVALVSEHVALRRVGRRWVGICPFHAEKTGSFSVNGELGLYYCFGCQARGDAISFLRETEHLDFVTALEALAGRVGIQLRYDREDRSVPGGKRAADLAKSLELAVDWYHERLLRGADAAQARRYLRSRGYDSETVKHFRLGWAPGGWDTLVRESGIADEMLTGVGLAYRNQAGRLNDSFRQRVLFPIFDVAGRAVGLGGRVLPGADGPKYKNTQATPLYDKSKVLYGLNWAKGAIVERGQVVVCEGYTDVIGLHRAGVTEAVATCGTALAEGHVRLLTGFSRRIVLAYDADSAGRGAAEHFYDWERRFEADISVVALSPGTDPADMAKDNPIGLREAVANARPYLGFRLERLFAAADLRNPEGRARAAEASMALISEHPDVLVRDQYLMQVSDRCRLSPEQLRALSRSGPRAPGRSGPSPGPTPGSTTAPATPTAPAAAKRRPPSVPRPELEVLRLVVHHPKEVGSRVDVALFSSDLAKAAFEELASAMTFHEAIESAPPEVADLLGQLGVEDSVEDPDDVVRRLIEEAANRALAELRREARSTAPSRSHGELSQISGTLRLALEALRSVEPGPDYEGRLSEAERALLALLLGSPSMSPNPVA
ncbi:MAG TPA: DNA primase [Acidimicrobiales bacterium]|nr:DNA primase [Acidimicrobiales bacterium]